MKGGKRAKQCAAHLSAKRQTRDIRRDDQWPKYSPVNRSHCVVSEVGLPPSSFSLTQGLRLPSAESPVTFPSSTPRLSSRPPAPQQGAPHCMNRAGFARELCEQRLSESPVPVPTPHALAFLGMNGERNTMRSPRPLVHFDPARPSVIRPVGARRRPSTPVTGLNLPAPLCHTTRYRLCSLTPQGRPCSGRVNEGLGSWPPDNSGP